MQANQSTKVLSTSNQTSYTFLVQDAGCASCVSKIESAIRVVPGVDRAEMNFAERSVQVTGGGSAHEIIQAVKDAGYTAVEAKQQDDQTSLDEKEQADHMKMMKAMKIEVEIS